MDEKKTTKRPGANTIDAQRLFREGHSAGGSGAGNIASNAADPKSGAAGGKVHGLFPKR